MPSIHRDGPIPSIPQAAYLDVCVCVLLAHVNTLKEHPNKTMHSNNTLLNGIKNYSLILFTGDIFFSSVYAGMNWLHCLPVVFLDARPPIY